MKGITWTEGLPKKRQMLFHALQLDAKQAGHLSNMSNLNAGIACSVFTGRQSTKHTPVVVHPKMMLFSFESEAWGTGSEHRKDVFQLHLPER